MGSINKIGDKKWRVRYRTPEGGSRMRTFAKRSDAERFLATTEHRKQTGEFVDPTAGRVRFDEHARRWLDLKVTAGRKPTSIATWRTHIETHLVPEFGAKQLREIQRDHVEAWAIRLAGSVAPTTARAIMATLRAILAAAVESGRLVRNPSAGVQVGAKTERRVDPLHIGNTAKLVPVLAENMPRRWRAAVLLMASTGLRLGECLGLTVDRVDFLRRTLRVDRQMVTISGSTGFGTPKTRAGVRTIPIPDPVVQLLAAHVAEFPPGDHGLLFTSTIGTPVQRSRWSEEFRKARAATGTVESVRTHDLRHVAASSLIAEGLSVAAVQAVLGHASPAETLEVYTHLWPTDEDRTRQAIEAASTGWLGAIELDSASGS
jgi:integrase